MPAQPLADELCQEAIDAFTEHGGTAAACKALNLNRSTYEGRMREARRRGFVSTKQPKLIIKSQSILHNNEGEQIARWDKSRLAGREPEDTVQLPDPKRITKMSTLYDQTGKVTQQWVSEKPEDVQREALWIECAEKIAAEVKRAAPVKEPRGASHKDLLAVYPVGDHHTGMMAWPDETGGDAYDLKIAEQIIREAALRLISVCPPCDQALIPFLGDFFHHDSFEAVTPAHRNLLDADGRYPKMIEVGVRIMRHMVGAALERHKHITLIVEPGNHDPASSAFMRILLACLYENEPRVTVDKAPRHYHYYEFGKVLLGTHHGDKAKPAMLPGIMAHDQPEAWGRTSHRLWMTGHVHHESRKEYAGCKVETFGVLAPADAYSAHAGYRSEQSMKAIVFHREHGEVERHTVSPDMFSRAA